MHARQLDGVVQKSGAKDESSSGPGRSPSICLTHLNAARPREKSLYWARALPRVSSSSPSFHVPKHGTGCHVCQYVFCLMSRRV